MEQSPAQTLPDDLLAELLGRLPPHSLAVSRCVCTAWRAVIDDRRLLRRDLLPLSLAGVFVNYMSDVAYSFAELFSPCWTMEKELGSSRGRGRCRYTYPPYTVIQDHCNGLLLLCGNAGVLNPATGWRTAALPECPPPAHAGMEEFRQQSYLVFDPTTTTTVPSHYEVFGVPRVPYDSTIGINVEELDEFGKGLYYNRIQIDEALLASQWPPSPYVLNVFSSATGQWEERAFHRDAGEEGAGTVADMRVDDHSFMRRRNAVYFRGALYVHCECDFVMRLSLSTNKYRMIKPPLPTVVCNFPELHLGKSENGIYFALLGDEDQLWVWILAETKGQEEWRLRHGTGAGLLLSSLNCIKKNHRQPWISPHVTRRQYDKENALGEHNEYESNSGSDEEEIIPHSEDNEQTHCSGYLQILAFHPYKEILFLHRSMRRGLAYHLNSTELEDLGDLNSGMGLLEDVGSCFSYSPCWI